MPMAFQLFEALISSGCQKIVVSGTCYEYGLQNGCLSDSPVLYVIYTELLNTLRENGDFM